MSNFVEQALAEQMEEVKRLKQLNQECGRSLKGLLEWSQKADMALEKCVEALSDFVNPSPEGDDDLEYRCNQALALARPLLKTRPEMN